MLYNRMTKSPAPWFIAPLKRELYLLTIGLSPTIEDAEASTGDARQRTDDAKEALNKSCFL